MSRELEGGWVWSCRCLRRSLRETQARGKESYPEFSQLEVGLLWVGRGGKWTERRLQPAGVWSRVGVLMPDPCAPLPGCQSALDLISSAVFGEDHCVLLGKRFHSWAALFRAGSAAGDLLPAWWPSLLVWEKLEPRSMG